MPKRAKRGRRKTKSKLIRVIYRKHIYMYQKDGSKKEKEHCGQDAMDVITHELGSTVRFFAVYDGHGIKGKEASQFARDEVRMALINDKKTLAKLKERKQVEKYFKKLMNSVQNKFKKRSQDFEQSGTCAICVLLVENHCFIINLGDSRAVIGTLQSKQRIAYQMSIDHKANREDEKKRIEMSGGKL